MNWGKIKHFSRVLALVGLFAVWVRAAEAGANSRVSGTYRAALESQASDQVRVRFQLHLVNHESRDLQIQRITVWDFAHPSRGATQACVVTLRAASSADTTQEFSVPRAEFELWKRRARPRVVLEIAGPAGRFSFEVVRLERVSNRKGN